MRLRILMVLLPALFATSVVSAPVNSSANAFQLDKNIGKILRKLPGNINRGRGRRGSKIIRNIIIATVGAVIIKELTRSQQRQLRRRERSLVSRNTKRTVKGNWKAKGGKKARITVGPTKPRKAFAPQLKQSKIRQDVSQSTAAVCRYSTVEIVANGKKGSRRTLWCRSAGGDWKAVAPVGS